MSWRERLWGATRGGQPTPGSPLLHVRALAKRYDGVIALDGLDLAVERGSCVALLGHNGSGKSTAVRCIGGQLPPSEGRVLIDGRDAADDDVSTRATRAVVPDAPAFYPDLTVREHLELVATAHGLGAALDATISAVLEEFGLTSRAEALPQQLSSGLRQRAQLACGVVRPFDLLLLDEPTQYLDAASSDRLRTRMLAEKARGAGILVTTHDPDLVRGVADEVIVLEDGVVAVRGDHATALASEAAARAGLRAPETR